MTRGSNLRSGISKTIHLTERVTAVKKLFAFAPASLSEAAHTIFATLRLGISVPLRGAAMLALLCAGFSSAASAQTAHFTGAQSVVMWTSSNGDFSRVAVDTNGVVYIGLDLDNTVYTQTPAPGGGWTQGVVKFPNDQWVGNLTGVAVDIKGQVYIADAGANDEVLRLTPSGGAYTVKVVADYAANGLMSPGGLAVDTYGNVYIADSANSRVLKETWSAAGDTYAQTVVASLAHGGLGAPLAVAVEPVTGNPAHSQDVYIADTDNSRVLRETWNGSGYTPTVVADNASGGVTGPTGVAVDSYGNVYIANGSGGKVLMETPSGTGYVQTTADESPDFPANSGGYFNPPNDVAVDLDGNLYISTNYNVLELAPSGANFGAVNLYPADDPAATLVFSIDEGGSFSAVSLLNDGVVSDGDVTYGLNYLPNYAGPSGCAANYQYTAGSTCTAAVDFVPTLPGAQNGAVALYNASGTQVAAGYLEGVGVGAQSVVYPSTAPQTQVGTGLSLPTAVALDGAGNVYVADKGSNRVLVEKQVAGGYAITTIANGGSGALAGVAVDSGGNVYVLDSVFNKVIKESPEGAGYSQSVVVSEAASGLRNPAGIAVDGQGNLYIADTGNNRVVRETLANGAYTQSVVDAFNLKGPTGVAVDGAGNVYIADTGHGQYLKETPYPFTSQTGFGGAPGFFYKITYNYEGFTSPHGVAVDCVGNIYMADGEGDRVLMLANTGSGYTVSALPTTGLKDPWGLAVDQRGDLFLADYGNSRVVREDYSGEYGGLAMSFATTVVGQTSSDSPKSATVMNFGNVPLTIPAPAYGTNPATYSSDENSPSLNSFVLNSGAPGDCPLLTPSSTAATLAVGTGCVLRLSFSPVGVGNVGGDVQMNFAAKRYAEPQAWAYVSLSGTSIAPPTAATPTFAPPAGTYPAAQNVAIVDATKGAAIYYTTDGVTTPTSASAKYTGPIAVKSTETIQAIAIAPGYTNSAVATALYNIGVVSPSLISTVAGAGTGCAKQTDSLGDGCPATQALLSSPWGVAVDSSGNLYIADASHNLIRKVTASTGLIATVAGGGTGCAKQSDSIGDGCLATSASLNGPWGIAVDSKSNIYIGDSNNNRVREVAAATGIITTIAGGGTGCASQTNTLGDGCSGVNAELNFPWGVAVDSAFNVYIGDSSHQRIRMVTAATSVISTVAGGGTGCAKQTDSLGDGCPATSAILSNTQGVAVDKNRNIYIADAVNARVRKVTAATGFMSTVAGTGVAGYNGDFRAATSAELWGSNAVAVDSNGNLYIAEWANQRVREVNTTTGEIIPIAGTGTSGYNKDGIEAVHSELSNPQGVAVDKLGNVYIADTTNGRIRKVQAAH
jgi:sugar lactone lactonase YvrE